jgi:hypothetical protein
MTRPEIEYNGVQPVAKIDPGLWWDLELNKDYPKLMPGTLAAALALDTALERLDAQRQIDRAAERAGRIVGYADIFDTVEAKNWQRAMLQEDVLKNFYNCLGICLPHPERGRPSSFLETVDSVHAGGALRVEIKCLDEPLEAALLGHLEKTRAVFMSEPFDHFRLRTPGLNRVGPPGPPLYWHI